MRNCKASAWRFFPDRPDLITYGRYVRAPRGTPHLPYPHWFGSINWREGEGPREELPLGELPGAAQWDRGLPEGELPPAVLLGSAECLARGERYPLAVVGRALRGGFDSRCWPVPVVPPAIPLRNIQKRETLLAFATTLETLYTDPALAAIQLQSLMGPSAVITVRGDDGSEFSGTLIGVHPDYSIVLITGTSNDVQLALQAMYADGGPISFGPFGTNPLWYANSTNVHARMLAAGVDPTKPLILVGHSYGGATASVLAGRYVFGARPGPVQLVTFGAPKPGDARLLDLLIPVDQVQLANAEDPVPFLPPAAADLEPLPIPPPLAFALRWEGYVRPPSQYVLFKDGIYVPVIPSLLSVTYLLSAVFSALTHIPFDPAGAHTMTTYRIRLGLIP